MDGFAQNLILGVGRQCNHLRQIFGNRLRGSSNLWFPLTKPVTINTVPLLARSKWYTHILAVHAVVCQYQVRHWMGRISLKWPSLCQAKA